MKIKKLNLSIVMGLGLACNVVTAMPDATQGNPLNLLGVVTPETVGDIAQDHQDSNTLYVGPAKVKEVQGVYTDLGNTGPMCIDYVNIQRQTYLMPVTATQKEQAVLDGDFVSNFFQMSYAIPAGSVDRLARINEGNIAVRRSGVENEALLTNYFKFEAIWTEIELALPDLKAELADIDDVRSDKLVDLMLVNGTRTNDCVLSNSTDVMAMTQCLTANITRYNAELAEIETWYQAESGTLRVELAEHKARKNEIRDAYYEASAWYRANQRELELLVNDFKFDLLIVNALMAVTSMAWDLEKSVLDAEEGKVVGMATAGYNLFTNESTALANTLAAAGLGQYNVKQLDVFNVRMNAGISLTNVTAQTSSGATLYHKNVMSFPADTLMSNGILNDWSMPFERENRGETLHFDSMDSNSFGAGGFNFFVTKGARCGEYQQEVEETYSMNTSGGEEVSWKVTNRYAEPKADQVVFSQAVGLSYSYYAYPGELKGECTIAVDRMNDYWRNAGKQSSWSWFKTTTVTWDKTRTLARNNLGMECKLDVVPQGANAAESQALAEAFERAMYDDMWQMFIAVYAKEYTVEILDPNTPELVKSTVGSNIGKGLMQICPANVFCQIGNVVLKTLDELGGSKAQGTTSAYNRTYGTIKKKYSKNSWVINQGNSLINVKVCVDPAQCK